MENVAVVSHGFQLDQTCGVSQKMHSDIALKLQLVCTYDIKSLLSVTKTAMRVKQTLHHKSTWGLKISLIHLETEFNCPQLSTVSLILVFNQYIGMLVGRGGGGGGEGIKEFLLYHIYISGPQALKILFVTGIPRFVSRLCLNLKNLALIADQRPPALSCMDL